MTLERLRILVAWIIVAIWVGLVVVQTIDQSRPVPASVHALMMVVAGFLFGPSILGRGRGGGS